MNRTTRWLLILILSGLATAPCLASAPWVTLQGGHYLIKRPNDGDSFHVSVEGHEYIFRLYFVDAPETVVDFAIGEGDKRPYSEATLVRGWKVGSWARRF